MKKDRFKFEIEIQLYCLKGVYYFLVKTLRRKAVASVSYVTLSQEHSVCTNKKLRLSPKLNHLIS